MLTFIAQIFVISFAVCIANEKISSEEKRNPDVLPINEDLPLIMVKGDYGGLAFPTSVEIIKKWYRRQKKIRFLSYFYRKQVFFCPAETEKQKNKIKTANEILDREMNQVENKFDNNCLFKKKKSKKITSRFPKCEKQPEPTMMKEIEIKQTSETEVNNENTQKIQPVRCGLKNKGQKLFFGYQVCEEYEGFNKFLYKFSDKKEVYPLNVTSFSIYDICYDIAKSEILYTSHDIMTPLLLKHYLLKNERKKCPAKNMATNELLHMPNINFHKVKSEFEKIDEGDTFKIQKLIPLEDFSFLLWKKPVNHFVNASLIHKELQECWNSIHDMIRNNAIQSGRRFKFFTKAFRYVDSSIGKTWNYKEKSERIPSLWVKLVYYTGTIYKSESKAVAIIANNYREGTVSDIIISKKLKCDSNLCWRVTKHNDECGKINRDIRCCEVSDQIKQLFGLSEIFKEVLDIAGLIEATSDSQPESPLHRSQTSPPR